MSTLQDEINHALIPYFVRAVRLALSEPTGHFYPTLDAEGAVFMKQLVDFLWQHGASEQGIRKLLRLMAAIDAHPDAEMLLGAVTGHDGEA